MASSTVGQDSILPYREKSVLSADAVCVEQAFLIMNVARNIAVIALCVALIVLGETTRRAVRDVSASVNNAAAEATGAARTLNDFLAVQSQQLQSEKNRKAIDAGLALAASAQGSVRLFNTETLPRLHTAIDTMNDSAGRLGALVSRTDASVNGQVMPALTRTLDSLDADAKAFGVTATEFNAAIKQMAASGQLTLQQVNEILSSAEWAEIRGNLKTATAEVAATSTQVRLASEQMPSVAVSLEKIARTSAKYEKALLLARLFSLVLGALRPW